MIEIGYIGKNNSTNAIIHRTLKHNFKCKIHRFEPRSLTQSNAKGLSQNLDLSIIDLHTIPGKAVNTVKTVAGLIPDAPLLVLDIHKEFKLIKPLLDEGAQGYLTTSTSESELTHAVNALMNGKTYISKLVRLG